MAMSTWTTAVCSWLRAWAIEETGADVPEYVLVLALIAMMAVGAMLVFSGKIQSAFAAIGNCLTSATGGSSSGCP
jgi:Flp pilus assembly pilin Flp